MGGGNVGMGALQILDLLFLGVNDHISRCVLMTRIFLYENPSGQVAPEGRNFSCRLNGYFDVTVFCSSLSTYLYVSIQGKLPNY